MRRPDFWDILWMFPLPQMFSESKCLKAQAMGGAASKGASEGMVVFMPIFNFAWEFCCILLFKAYLWRLCFLQIHLHDLFFFLRFCGRPAIICVLGFIFI